MGQNSKIEWCDHPVNLWWGCFEVNKACDNCYAKSLANRYHHPEGYLRRRKRSQCQAYAPGLGQIITLTTPISQPSRSM